jgi:hypothetical protein
VASTRQPYSYGNNNPITYMDPTGLRACIGAQDCDGANDLQHGTLYAIWDGVGINTDAVHVALDVVGLVPGLGEPADGTNAALYAAEGNKTDAALSAAGAVPFLGWGATLGKWFRRGAKAVDKADDASDVLRAGDKALDAAGAVCSFSGETRVLMADGTTKPISEIEVGDFVLAYDPETGERGPRKVTHLWVHVDSLLELDLGGAVVATTEDHPFWNETDQVWRPWCRRSGTCC